MAASDGEGEEGGGGDPALAALLAANAKIIVSLDSATRARDGLTPPNAVEIALAAQMESNVARMAGGRVSHTCIVHSHQANRYTPPATWFYSKPPPSLDAFARTVPRLGSNANAHHRIK